MNLSINYDETRNLGNQVITKAQTFGAQVTNVNNLNGEMSQVWTGPDANKYLSAVSEQVQYMKELASTIELIGNYLVNVGNTYEKAAMDNANSIR